MTAEIWQWLGQILAPLGGAGVVAWAVAKYFADRSIETHKSELNQETERLKAELGRDVETHKWKLKKKEILFEKEFEAASEFFVLRRKIEPKFRDPDMDYSEAMEEVIERFSSAQDSLRNLQSMVLFCAQKIKKNWTNANRPWKTINTPIMRVAREKLQKIF